MESVSFLPFSRMLVSLHPCCNITPSASLVSSAKSDFIINKKVIDHLTKNNPLSDKEYGFHTLKFTTDILTAITHRIIEAVDGSISMRVITLDISKAFDKV